MRSAVFGFFVLASTFFCALPVLSQDYPTKPIRVVVPFPPGGGMADRMARLVSDKLRDKFGQALVVENRAGANANIGAEFVAKAPGDGYTLLFSGEGPIVINKFLYPKLPYDPDQFVPVSAVISQSLILVTHPKVPINNLQQLLAYAKANPNKLNLATNGSGSNMHLTLEMLQLETGVKIAHVAYKGVPPALTDLLGGQVEMMFVGLGTVQQQVKAGKLRIIATASEKRMAAIPDIAPIAETLPGFAATTWFGLVAPAKTPPAIAERLSSAVRDALKQPDVVTLINDLSVEAIGSTPDEMAAMVKRERERWGKVIRTIGVTLD
ncbi:MAG: Bug family tripartite tricarboxylate transporter substrate binding protein [Burkholderiales bacterium]